MLVTIARFSFPYEAHIARAKLESVGIPSWVADEHTVNMQWLYSNALGGVRLQVHPSYAKEAVEVLKESNLNDLVVQQGEDVTVCPQCGGSDIQIKPEGKGPAVLMILVLGFPIWPVDQFIHCKACGKKSPFKL